MNATGSDGSVDAIVKFTTPERHPADLIKTPIAFND